MTVDMLGVIDDRAAANVDRTASTEVHLRMSLSRIA